MKFFVLCVGFYHFVTPRIPAVVRQRLGGQDWALQIIPSRPRNHKGRNGQFTLGRQHLRHKARDICELWL